MYVAFVAGGIASGKSSFARRLQTRGARRIDLDQLSREVLAPGSDCLKAVAREFGGDLLDPVTGELDRALLAQRAFATAGDTARLEAIELPHIGLALMRRLASLSRLSDAPSCVVVEVPLLDRFQSYVHLADEVVAIACPLGERRRRAIGRGMDGADFDARAARQPSDEYLGSHCDTLVDNRGGADELMARADAWWDSHQANGWRPARKAE